MNAKMMAVWEGRNRAKKLSRQCVLLERRSEAKLMSIVIKEN